MVLQENIGVEVFNEYDELHLKPNIQTSGLGGEIENSVYS